MIFDSFWHRLGVVLRPIWGSKIDPKILHAVTLRGLDFDLVIDWSQDGSKTVPRGLLGGVLGPSLEGLGELLSCLEGVLAAHEAINGSFWNAIRCFNSSMRFSGAIRRFDSFIG